MNVSGQVVYIAVDHPLAFLLLSATAPCAAAITGAGTRARWAARLAAPCLLLASGCIAVDAIASRRPPANETDASGMALVVMVILTLVEIMAALGIGEVGRAMGRAIIRRR